MNGIINDHTRFTVSSREVVCDNGQFRRMGYTVTRKEDGSLAGYVARSRCIAGGWCYALASDSAFCYAGGTRAMAVDHLISNWSPGARWLS
jgi:hypothetical protein